MKSNATTLIGDLVTFHIRLQKKLDTALCVHGINFTEYLILKKLQDTPQKSMRRIDLAETTGLSASGITRLINPLEKRQIVEKKSLSKDARVSLVQLSTAGMILFEDADKTLESITEKILEPLTEKEQLQLSQLVKTLV